MTTTLNQTDARPLHGSSLWTNLAERLKKFWRPETGIFLGLWLVLMVGGRSKFFHDPGTFWHTVVGEQMLSSGRLIDTDSFTFTFAGRTWIA
ncbi:MAG: hypothetical protein JO112_06500, partial [Planctomycetes bacterium]|nr:hypothetical protein [Planctomycetota bacterium]